MHPTDNANDSWTILLCLAVAGCIALWWLDRHAAALNGPLLHLAILELRLPALFSAKAAHLADVLRRIDPAAISPEEALEILSLASDWYVWPSIAAVAAMGWIGFRRSPADRYRRRFTMNSLLENNRATSPCIAPILNWPRSILDEPADAGPWMVARQPVQFAAEQGLLYHVADRGRKETERTPVPSETILAPDSAPVPPSSDPKGTQGVYLDREKARRVFRAQCGPRTIPGDEDACRLDSMPAYVRKLFVAFLLFAAERKAEAHDILDAMSVSFRPPIPARPGRWELLPFPRYRRARQAKPCTMDLDMDSPGDDEIRELLDRPDIRRALAPHLRYRNLMVLAMYRQARTKGVLATSEFIWLRPVDRPLFYLLNNCGRKVAWPEIAGAWAHFKAEDRIADDDDLCPEDMTEPLVDEAVKGLEESLLEDGRIALAVYGDDPGSAF
ncbi:MAG: hypothetical protein LBR22_06850 [Desulfovibrio sp.]|jgi:hypothetical protein|nr:hypothetical protein [Desulfovibrio sp.]